MIERTEKINKLSTLVITREYLISLLHAWKKNQITTVDIYTTASQLYDVDNKILLDWEDDESFSATIEMLQYLESLELNFVIQEDIEPAIEFLNTEIGSSDKGWKKWQQYRTSINHKDRMRMLKGQYPYIYDEEYLKE